MYHLVFALGQPHLYSMLLTSLLTYFAALVIRSCRRGRFTLFKSVDVQEKTSNSFFSRECDVFIIIFLPESPCFSPFYAHKKRANRSLQKERLEQLALLKEQVYSCWTTWGG